MKKLLAILACLLLLLAIGVGYFFYSTGGSGSGGIETWIGSQLQAITNSYLKPTLSFDDLDYQYPGTVKLSKLRLTTDDPRQPGRKLDIIACDEAELTLARIPRAGEPVIIRAITLRKPLVAAVALDTGSVRMAGFSDLLVKDAPSTTQKKPRPQLSDYFKINRIDLQDGRILYDPRIAGTEAMELDQINTQLDINPNEAGEYTAALQIGRKPVFDASLRGTVNLDSFAVRDLELKLDADLSADKLSYLPPQLQKLLAKYEARGTLGIRLNGNVKTTDLASADLHLAADLTDANLRLDPYRIPIEKLSLAAHVRNREAQLESLKISALKGNAEISGSVQLRELMQSRLNLSISEMRMEELLSHREEGKPTELAGQITANLNAEAPLRVLIAKSSPATQPNPLAQESLPDKWGEGKIRIQEGNLALIPVVRQLNEVLRAATGLITGSMEPRDQLHADLTLASDQVVVNDFKFITKVAAARGRGTVSLQRELDLTVNAGPIEKMQSLLGGVGDLIGKVTDQIVAYRITGPAGNATISLQVAGGALGAVKNAGEKVGEGVKGGVEKIGEGIGNIFK